MYSLLFFIFFVLAKKDFPSDKKISFAHFKNIRIIVSFIFGYLYLFLFVLFHKNISFSLEEIIYLLPFIPALYYSLQSSFLRIDQSKNQPIFLSEQIEKFLKVLENTTNKTNFVREIQKFFSEQLKINQFAFYEITEDIQPFKLLWYENIQFDKLKKIDLYAQDLFNLMKEKSEHVLVPVDVAPDELRQYLEELEVKFFVPLIYQGNALGIIFVGGSSTELMDSVGELGWSMLSHQIAPRLAVINVINKEVEVQKMAELGVMASQIAHDFKSFLTLIKINMPDDELIDRQVNYLSKLVKDISTYAKVKSTEKVLTDIHAVIDSSLESVQIPSNIIIEKNYGKEIPKTFLDPIQMQRVFNNLIENSIRAMPDGGKIKINTRLIKSIAARDRKWIYIEFIDEGVGIPEEDLSRIFEPFYTTFKKKGGTGMGLAITKQIIRRHAGFIDVTSKPGKGTIFNIRIPAINKMN